MDVAVAPWPFAPPLDAVLRGLKFGRLDYLGPDLAELLLPAVRDQVVDATAVCAVPLHRWRRLTRGFDQAESIARPLARAMGLPYRPLLSRRRYTRPQTGLDRTRRRANLANAFVARRAVTGSILLVDDVVTTGATVTAAAAALEEAGAHRITVVAVTATPAQKEGFRV